MFELVSDYSPAGDQPQAIAKLSDGVLSGAKHQAWLARHGQAFFLHHPNGWDSFRTS